MAAFVLAHLSDPHLATMPRPRAAELASKRALGYYNWRQRRHAIHRIETLNRLVSDLKAAGPDHIAVTGDLVNIALADEFVSARAWLASLGEVKRRLAGAGQSRRLCAADRRPLAAALDRLHER